MEFQCNCFIQHLGSSNPSTYLTLLTAFLAASFFACAHGRASDPASTSPGEFRIENEFFRVSASEQGAELQSVVDVRGKTELLWQGDKKYWASRSPVLFPIVGRVHNSVYVYGGKTYRIDSPHGFALRSRFEATADAPDRMTFRLVSSEKTLVQYPFPFRFEIEYSLENSSLCMTFRVENTGKETMPFSVGAHPGFRVPLGENERFEDYRLEFAEPEKPTRILLDGVFISGKKAPFLPTGGKIIPLERQLFDDEAVILGEIGKKTISLVGPADRKRWSLHFDDFRYLALWQPERSDAPFVSLEPWDGLPDLSGIPIAHLDRKQDVTLLPPGKKAQFRLVFELH